MGQHVFAHTRVQFGLMLQRSAAPRFSMKGVMDLGGQIKNKYPRPPAPPPYIEKGGAAKTCDPLLECSICIFCVPLPTH